MNRPLLPALLLTLLTLAPPARAQHPDPSALFAATLKKLSAIAQPADGAVPQTFSAELRLTRSDGLPKQAKDAVVHLAYQAPDRLLISAQADNQTFSAARDRNNLWAYVPAKKFAVLGSPHTPRFANDPSSIDALALPPFKSPLGVAEMLALPLLIEATSRPDETINEAPCHVLSLRLLPRAANLLGIQTGTGELAVRKSDGLPARLRYADGKVSVELTVINPRLSAPWPAEKWRLNAADGDHVEKVANSHLTRFLDNASKMARQKIPTLGPAAGRRTLVAASGAGRLEEHDGTRVLFLKGTPEEMGRQHGELLRKEVRNLTERILFGVGVGSSFAKGKWFFGEIEQAHARLAPFISGRTYRELDALAAASGLPTQEVRLANFFPELFHCTGFAIHGEATAGGRIFHGRVLDYLRGVGLEQNATVMVFQPDQGHAWVNVGYAGFIGTVTAMNEKQISIGEMGGRGEGNWDGKPMAQLLREVMENASTLEEAVEIMRKGPRTCEYYYVIADGKTKQSIAIKATPTLFETVPPGGSHPQLTRPVKDTVLLSAGDRYNALVDRVNANYGKFDASTARALMDPPVCMSSNIHSVLFAPDTLDFWVANADSANVASKARYTHYNLADLLKSPPAAKPSTGSALLPGLW